MLTSDHTCMLCGLPVLLPLLPHQVPPGRQQELLESEDVPCLVYVCVDVGMLCVSEDILCL